MDFPALMRGLSAAGANLLVAPADDWEAIKEMHLRMAIVRAIENGVPLLRPASSGLSGAVDALGRVLAVTDHLSPGVRVMIAQLPVGSPHDLRGHRRSLCLALHQRRQTGDDPGVPSPGH
jgi:apolipoprotein N-acyltransferase